MPHKAKAAPELTATTGLCSVFRGGLWQCLLVIVGWWTPDGTIQRTCEIQAEHSVKIIQRKFFRKCFLWCYFDASPRSIQSILGLFFFRVAVATIISCLKGLLSLHHHGNVPQSCGIYLRCQSEKEPVEKEESGRVHTSCGFSWRSGLLSK